MIYCEGRAVWNGVDPHQRVENRHDHIYTYQIEVPLEVVRRRLWVITDAVNASRQLPAGYVAVHPPLVVAEVSEFAVAA